MPVTLLALYQRPEGGDEALERFRERYAAEHLPLIRAVPGLRSVAVSRVRQAVTESDLVMSCEMVFDTPADLEAGLASDEMRAAGRQLRSITQPGMMTLVVLEPEPATISTGAGTLDVLREAHAERASGDPAGREPMPDSRASTTLEPSDSSSR
jgi:uncharacterized protein (TIGR02118 family)